MKKLKAYIITVPHNPSRPGETAEILSVTFATLKDGGKPVACYHVRFNSDDQEELVPMRDERTGFDNLFIFIVSEEQIDEELRPLVERYKKELKFRDGGRAAEATYADIKKIATPSLLVKLHESMIK